MAAKQVSLDKSVPERNKYLKVCFDSGIQDLTVLIPVSNKKELQDSYRIVRELTLVTVVAIMSVVSACIVNVTNVTNKLCVKNLELLYSFCSENRLYCDFFYLIFLALCVKNIWLNVICLVKLGKIRSKSCKIC